MNRYFFDYYNSSLYNKILINLENYCLSNLFANIKYYIYFCYSYNFSYFLSYKLLDFLKLFGKSSFVYIIKKIYFFNRLFSYFKYFFNNNYIFSNTFINVLKNLFLKMTKISKVFNYIKSEKLFPTQLNYAAALGSGLCKYAFYKH